MTIQHTITQKEYEGFFLSNFLQYYSKYNPDFSNYSIINSGEAPDFIIESNKTKYAIEITEYFKGVSKKNGGSIERLEFSKKRKLKEYIQSAYERKCSILLNVNIIWSEFDFSQLDRKTLQLIADVFSDKLVEITQLDPPIIWAFNNLDAFVKDNILSKYVSWIDVSYKTPMDTQKNFFDFSESGYLEDPIPKVKHIIKEKSNKLETYISNLEMQKVQFDKFWLLIDANGRHISSSANFEKIKKCLPAEICELEKSFEYTFNNIFIYDTFSRRIAQIK